jgi:hypothetical protein
MGWVIGACSAALVVIGVGFFSSNPSVIAVTSVGVENGEARAEYGSVRCADWFDDFPSPYPGAASSGSGLVLVEQAQACAPARRARHVFGGGAIGAGLGSAWFLVRRKLRRQPVDLGGVDLDEARWALSAR